MHVRIRLGMRTALERSVARTVRYGYDRNTYISSTLPRRIQRTTARRSALPLQARTYARARTYNPGADPALIRRAQVRRSGRRQFYIHALA